MHDLDPCDPDRQGDEARESEAAQAPDSGTLADWPVPVLLAHVASEEGTASLVIDERHQFVLRDGMLAAAWTEGVDEQGDAHARIARAVAVPEDRTFTLRRGEDLLYDRTEADVDCHGLEAILAAARAWDDATRIDAEIEAMLGDAALRLDPEISIDELAPTPEERALAARLVEAGADSYAALLSESAPDVARPFVWALAVTQYLSPVPTTSLLAAEDHARALQAIADGDLASAEDWALRAVECDPRPEHRALLGYLRGMRGPAEDLPIAIALLDRAIADDETCARAFVYRAKLNERAGRAARASQDWSRAVALDPDDPDAQRAIARMPTIPPAAPAEPQKRGLLASLGGLFSGRPRSSSGER